MAAGQSLTLLDAVSAFVGYVHECFSPGDDIRGHLHQIFTFWLLWELFHSSSAAGLHVQTLMRTGLR